MTDEEAYQKSIENANRIGEKGYGTFFECCGQSFDKRAEFIQHLADVHDVDVKTQKFTRNMLMHMDGRDWFASSYSMSCDAVTFTEYSKTKRSRNDPFRSF